MSENSQAFHQLPIPRDCIRVKELREIIQRTQLLALKEEYKISIRTFLNDQLYEEHVLALQDSVRRRSRVELTRIPAMSIYNLCQSCYDRPATEAQLCCAARLCSNCFEHFQRLGKCYFQLTPLCSGLRATLPSSARTRPSLTPRNDISKVILLLTDQARFHIVKTNRTNFELSLKHSRWITSRRSYGFLHQSFILGGHVILIFRSSKHLLGLALMRSSFAPERAIQWQQIPGVIQECQFECEHFLTKALELPSALVQYADCQQVVDARLSFDLCIQLLQQSYKEQLSAEHIESLQRIQEEGQKQVVGEEQVSQCASTINEVDEPFQETRITVQNTLGRLKFEGIPGLSGKSTYVNQIVQSLMKGGRRDRSRGKERQRRFKNDDPTR